MDKIIYNEIVNGNIVDPISFEEIKIEDSINMNNRFYSPETIKQLLSCNVPKDPFTREILSSEKIISLEVSSSCIDNLYDIMNPK